VFWIICSATRLAATAAFPTCLENTQGLDHAVTALGCDGALAGEGCMGGILGIEIVVLAALAAIPLIGVVTSKTSTPAACR
jgi:hypothetical protein